MNKEKIGYWKWWYNKDKNMARFWVIIFMMIVDAIIFFSCMVLDAPRLVAYITGGIILIFCIGGFIWMICATWIADSIRAYNNYKNNQEGIK